MRNELHKTMMRFVKSMMERINMSGLPTTPEYIQERMGVIYDFLAIARTPIHRDYRSDEIDEIPESEFPTRICNTVSRLCEVHASFYGRDEVGLEDMDFGRRIILDNIPTRRWQILKIMGSEWLTISIIARKSDMSTGAAKRVLDELISLKLVDRLPREEKTEEMDRRADSYKIADKWVKVVEELRGVIPGDSITELEDYSLLINKENIHNKNSPPQLNKLMYVEGEAPRTGKIERLTPDKKLLCAVCGADLAEHGYIEKNGKFYCAQPGCGYPPREKITT